MTAQFDDDDAAAIAAASRVVEINALYFQMRQSMHLWLTECEDLSSSMTKSKLNKISDIQHAHVLVLKAEDAFNDRQKAGAIADAIVDLDEIKAEIGRKLDGLRNAIAESSVSEEPDSGGG